MKQTKVYELKTFTTSTGYSQTRILIADNIQQALNAAIEVAGSSIVKSLKEVYETAYIGTDTNVSE